MVYRHPDIYELLETLTLEEKSDLCEYLQNMIALEKSIPEKSYLEKKWDEIERLLTYLSYELYIDDQNELNDIWMICEELVKSNKLGLETWETRRRVLEDIIEENYYNDYGLDDPMRNLLFSLIITPEEKLECADMAFRFGYGMVRADLIQFYKECGQEEKYYSILEGRLGRESKPYLELIEYYQNKDIEKAVALAEKGLTKCRDGQTKLMIFLIKYVKQIGDTEKYDRLIRSARRRKLVDYSRVLDALDEK